jgi:hypothetical protein
MALWLFMSTDRRLAALRESSGNKLRKYVRRSLHNTQRDIRDTGVLEGLRRGDDQLRDEVVKALEHDQGSVFRMLDCFPSLVALALTDTTVSADARRALSLLGRRLPAGPDACPRCGGDSARTGNATGWTCNECSFNYNPSGPRDPLTFRMGDLWGCGPPWFPKKIADLIARIEAAGNDLRGQDAWRAGVLRESEDLTKIRQRILQQSN